MRRFRNILVVCNEHGVSVSLFERVRWLAETNGAAVTVMDVVATSLAGEEADSAGRLAGLIRPFDKRYGTRRQVHHPMGTASEILVRQAEKRRGYTIVMGTVGRVGVTGFLIGETAETIFGQVACSVPATKPQGFQPPVEAVPVTGTAGS